MPLPRGAFKRHFWEFLELKNSLKIDCFYICCLVVQTQWLLLCNKKQPGNSSVMFPCLTTFQLKN